MSSTHFVDGTKDSLSRFGYTMGVKLKPSGTANNVRALRQAAGLTLADLASRLVPPADVGGLQKIETGQRNLTLDWMTRIASALDVPKAALIADAGPTVAWVPLIGFVAAGNWQAAVEHSESHVPVVDPPPDAFALEVRGTSMDKLVPDGGFVVVAPHQRDLLDNKVYVAMNPDGDTTLKRFVSGPPPRFEPVSNDPSHRSINLGHEPLTVIGRIVWVGGAV